MARAFIALGSNIGNRRDYLNQAKYQLASYPGIKRIKISGIYETDPVGGPAGQGLYLNAAAEVETELTPRQLLDCLLDIEKKMGRERTVKNAPRTLDLDLVLYADLIVNEPNLVVPHPKMHERAFVLEPLMDLAPDIVHPVLQKTVRQLMSQLNEKNN